MKKSLLSVIAMVVAGFGLANATVEMTTANVQQPAGDTLLFALPVDVNVYQGLLSVNMMVKWIRGYGHF